MTCIFDIWTALQKRLRRRIGLALGLPAVFALPWIVLAFFLPWPWLTAALCGVVTAGMFCAFLYSIYTELLPYHRTDRLLSALQGEEESTVDGVYLGEKNAFTMRDGVRMRVLRLDAEDTVKGEPVERELHLPASFLTDLQAGSRVRLSVSHGVMTGVPSETKVTVRLHRGGLAVPRIQYFLAVILAAVLWLGGYEAVQHLTAPETVDAAVCTLAYHAESEAVLQDAAKERSLSLSFAYSTTLDDETLYQYLATYGTFEADLLLLPLSDYLGTFEAETPPLPAVPDGVRTVTNSEGAPVAAVLYDPADPGYSALFSGIVDWIAIPKDDAYVLSLAPSANAAASDAATVLLSALLQNDFPKE